MSVTQNHCPSFAHTWYVAVARPCPHYKVFHHLNVLQVPYSTVDGLSGSRTLETVLLGGRDCVRPCARVRGCVGSEPGAEPTSCRSRLPAAWVVTARTFTTRWNRLMLPPAAPPPSCVSGGSAGSDVVVSRVVQHMDLVWFWPLSLGVRLAGAPVLWRYVCAASVLCWDSIPVHGSRLCTSVHALSSVYPLPHRWACELFPLWLLSVLL